MMIGVKGKQLCAGNPNADDRRTDMVIPVYPPNFVAGGINIAIHVLYTFFLHQISDQIRQNSLCSKLRHKCSQKLKEKLPFLSTFLLILNALLTSRF